MFISFKEYETQLSEGKFINWLLNKTPVQDEPKKGKKQSTTIDSVMTQFYRELENYAKTGHSIIYDNTKKYKKSDFIMTIQIGLQGLGIDLPKFVIDGILGPETANAIIAFMKQYSQEVQLTNTAIIDSKFVKLLISILKRNEASFRQLVAKQRGGIDSIDVSKINANAGASKDDEVYKAILQGIGANVTDQKLLFMRAWRQGEGGTATNNPFNTTRKLNVPGITVYNSHGVRNYPDINTGIFATIDTLKLSYYRNLVSLLQNDNVTATELANSPDLHTWGTKDNIKRVLQSGKINPPSINYA